MAKTVMIVEDNELNMKLLSAARQRLWHIADAQRL
jgi:hypothetical protein